jgi:hypothetical protein
VKRPALVILAIALSAAGCASSEGSTEAVTVTGPTRTDFEKVAETLDYHCGNLACHGSKLRNLRLYGDQGLRLAGDDVPCGAPTTVNEFDADYRSLVALEPEIIDAVVANGGQDPARLTLVRKARAREKHEGGAVFRDGTDIDACTTACAGSRSERLCVASCYGDRCLTSWLTGDVDVPACGNALPETRCNPL